MCLSSVYIDSDGQQQQEVMRDAAQTEAKGDGFVLIELLGEQKFILAKVSRITFVDNHSVVLKKGNIASFIALIS